VRKRIIAFIEFFHLPLFQFIPAETFRYLFCGVSTILVDWVVYYLSSKLIFLEPMFKNVIPGINEITPETLSLIAAFVASFVWGFGLNKYVVFTTSAIRGRIQLFRYSVIVASCIFLNYILMKLFIANGTNQYMARIMVSLMVAVYSYVVQRAFTFKVVKQNK
jgi:putative flippase GtrA